MPPNIASQHVGIYARISQDKGGKAEGVAEQVRWGREYAEATWPGVPVVEYAENNISGTDDERPELSKMRLAILSGECVQVATTVQSRLTRSYFWFQMGPEMLAAGIEKIHTRHDGIVEVMGLVSDVMAVINIHYIKTMKKALMDRLNANAAKGQSPGSLPFGYRHGVNDDGDKTYIQVPEQADAIRWAAEMVLGGWSLSRVAAGWRERGLVGAHGGKLGPAQVRSALTKPTVAGWRVHSGQVVGKGNWPAILDESVWQACRAKLSAPRKVERIDGGSYPVTAAHTGYAGRRYTLTGGLIVCGVCGAAMVASLKQLKGGAKRGGRDVPYYLCHSVRGGKGCTGIMAERTEAYVENQLWAELDKPEFLSQLAVDDHAARRDEITVELTALDARRAVLGTEWATGSKSSAFTDAALAAIDESERLLRDELTLKAPPPAVVDIEQARAAWPRMELGERREFIRLFVERVTIMRAKPGTMGFDNGRVNISWKMAV